MEEFTLNFVSSTSSQILILSSEMKSKFLLFSAIEHYPVIIQPMLRLFST